MQFKKLWCQSTGATASIPFERSGLLVPMVFWVCVCLALFSGTANSNQDNLDDQVRAFLESSGPWPPTPVKDLSNRYSGNPKAVELGDFLFRETRLSRTGSVSCFTCHITGLGYTDGLPVARGIEPVTRNTPSTLNLAGLRWFGWDGAADSLWAQSIRPLFSKQEMDGADAAVRALYESDEDFRLAYTELTGKKPEDSSDDELLVLTGKALAAFQETLVSERTSFDDFRDAVVAGDTEEIRNYPESAARGANLFFGEGNCAFCHFGPAFTNNEFASIGLPHMLPDGGVDKGRFAGINMVRQSPYNRLGRFNDDPSENGRVSTRLLRHRHDSFGEFKVPGLRSIRLTAPYMHDGSLATLEEVVEHYSEINLDRLHTDGESILKPLSLTPEEQRDLVNFLKTL